MTAESKIWLCGQDESGEYRALLARLLELEGVMVTLTTTSELQTHTLKRQVPPDLVLIIDCGINPYTDAKILKQLRHPDSPYGKTPVIALSADDSPDTEKILTKAGADAFILKPFSSQVLLETISSLHQKTEARHV